MITFTTKIRNVLLEPVVEAFYLLKVYKVLANGTITNAYFKTTYPRDLVVGDTAYVSDGSIVSIMPPQMTSSVDRQIFKITLTDPEEGLPLGYWSEEGILGMTVEVRIGFVDQETEKPLLNVVDTLLIYKGVIDSTGYSISTSKIGAFIYELGCSSPMSDLDLIKAYYTSQDYLDKNHPGDTSYSQIYEGSGPVSLRWGKE